MESIDFQMNDPAVSCGVIHWPVFLGTLLSQDVFLYFRILRILIFCFLVRYKAMLKLV